MSEVTDHMKRFLTYFPLLPRSVLVLRFSELVPLEVELTSCCSPHRMSGQLKSAPPSASLKLVSKRPSALKEAVGCGEFSPVPWRGEGYSQLGFFISSATATGLSASLGGDETSQSSNCWCNPKPLGQGVRTKASLVCGDEQQMMVGVGGSHTHKAGGWRSPLSRWWKDKEGCPWACEALGDF